MHHAGNEHMLGSDVWFYRGRSPLIDLSGVVDPLELTKLILYASPWHVLL